MERRAMFSAANCHMMAKSPKKPQLRGVSIEPQLRSADFGVRNPENHIFHPLVLNPVADKT